MDSTRAFLLLGLMALALLILSKVSARDLTETSINTKEEIVEKSNEVNNAKYGTGGYHHNATSPPPPVRHRSHRGYHGAVVHVCYYGCCGGYFNGFCRSCCSYAGEDVVAQTEVNNHN